MAVTFTDADFVLLIDLSALCALRVMRETSEVDAVRARIFFLPKAVEDYIRSDDVIDDVFAYLFFKAKKSVRRCVLLRYYYFRLHLRSANFLCARTRVLCTPTYNYWS